MDKMIHLDASRIDNQSMDAFASLAYAFEHCWIYFFVTVFFYFNIGVIIGKHHIETPEWQAQW